MPLYTPILRVWCPLNEHTPVVLLRPPLLKNLTAGAATERTVEGLYPFQGEGVTSTGAVAQQCRFTQCILISNLETGATASTNWFPQMLHPRTGPSVMHLLRPAGFHRCNATVVIARHHQSLRWSGACQ